MRLLPIFRPLLALTVRLGIRRIPQRVDFRLPVLGLLRSSVWFSRRIRTPLQGLLCDRQAGDTLSLARGRRFRFHPEYNSSTIVFVKSYSFSPIVEFRNPRSRLSIALQLLLVETSLLKSQMEMLSIDCNFKRGHHDKALQQIENC